MSSTFAPDGERRLPAGSARTTARTSRRSRATRKHDADAYDQYSHDMEMVCQAHQAAARHGRRRTSSATTPRSCIALALARLAVPEARQARAPQRRPAADRQRRRLPRRLLRVGHRSRATSPRRASSGRRSGRARRARVWCCCTTRSASTTASSGRGRSTRRATAASPGARSARRSRSAPRSSSSRRSII